MAGMISSRRIIAVALTLVILSLGLGIVGVARYPAILSQPGARMFIYRPLVVLLAYACAFVAIALRRWSAVPEKTLSLVTFWGILTGAIEILDICLENGIPLHVHLPGVALAFMAVVFGCWGAAGFQAARFLNSIRAGVISAALSAAICMLIATASGFAIQILVTPPDPAYVSTWAEFTRSGWNDTRAFALANTLDSGFTHLVVAPVVAILVGGLGSFLGYSTVPRQITANS
jgi:hypothetical protein